MTPPVLPSRTGPFDGGQVLAPLPGRTGPFPDLDPRIEAAAAALWDARTVEDSDPWGVITTEAPGLADEVRRDAAAAIAAADRAARPDPRIDVVAETLYEVVREAATPWALIPADLQEHYRGMASPILAALDAGAPQ